MPEGAMFTDDHVAARCVAHDVRNLLHGALLGLERTALATDTSLDDAREAIGAAHSILQAAAQAAGERLPRPITKDVLFVLDLWCGPGAGGPVALQIHAAPLVVADRWAVRRAILNLLFNARAASLATSPICVEVSSEPGEAVIRIRDRGRGLEASVLERLRTPEPPPAGEIHGLGLAGTTRAIEAIGGRLELESSLGRGTTATLRLPAIDRRGATEERTTWTADRQLSPGSS
jgi:signal transduction histidine kinase